MGVKIDEEYLITVVSIKSKGIIVKLDNESETEFIHISKISPAFVSDISNFVGVGDKLVAKGVKSDVKNVELSLLHLNLNPSKSNADSKPKDQYNRKSTKKAIGRQSVPAIQNDLPPTLEDMIKKSNSQLQEHQQALNARLRRKHKT